MGVVVVSIRESKAYLPPEGRGRKVVGPALAERDHASPRCVVKVDWLNHELQGLREDLGPVAFAEYATGGPTAARGRGPAGEGVVSKGVGGGPVAMFVSHPMSAADATVSDKSAFATKWLRRDPSLGGHDGSRWTIENAWAVHLLRRTMRAQKFERGPAELRHYRFRVCPEKSAGTFLRESARMEEFGRRFMRAVEQDYTGNFVWVGAAHYNTENPHLHICVRGIDVQGCHVYLPHGAYLKPSAIEQANNPAASSPVEWRARNILGEMMREGRAARDVG